MKMSPRKAIGALSSPTSSRHSLLPSPRSTTGSFRGAVSAKSSTVASGDASVKEFVDLWNDAIKATGSSAPATGTLVSKPVDASIPAPEPVVNLEPAPFSLAEAVVAQTAPADVGAAEPTPELAPPDIVSPVALADVPEAAPQVAASPMDASLQTAPLDNLQSTVAAVPEVEVATDTVLGAVATADLGPASTEAVPEAAQQALDTVVSVVASASDAATSIAATAAPITDSAATLAAVAPSEASASAVDAAVQAAAPAVSAPASQSMSLAAQRYAEMTGKAAKVAAPKADAAGPSFALPDFKMPSLSAPKVSVPSEFSAPSAPKLSLTAPEVDLPDVGGAVSGAAAEAAAAVQGVAGSVGAQVSQVTGSVTSALGAATAELGSEVQSVTRTVNGAVGSAVSNVQLAVSSATEAVEGSVAAVSAAVSSQADQVYSGVVSAAAQVYETLPPPAQAVAHDLGDLAYAFVSHPGGTAVLSTLVGAPFAAAAVYDRYGGYAGDVSPARLKEMLDYEDAVLVDVRADDMRKVAGVPQLKKAARYKAAALPLDAAKGYPAPRPGTAKVPVTDDMVVARAAILISGLTLISSATTRVVLMAQGAKEDKRMRQLAKAMMTLGEVEKVMVLEGGFDKWVADGLAIEAGRPDYDNSRLSVLKDEVAEVAEELLPKVQDPAFVLPLLSAVSTATIAVANYHNTLRLIAVWGISYSIYAKLSSYNSPQELFQEVADFYALLSSRGKDDQRAERAAEAGDGSTMFGDLMPSAAGAAALPVPAAATSNPFFGSFPQPSDSRVSATPPQPMPVPAVAAASKPSSNGNGSGNSSKPAAAPELAPVPMLVSASTSAVEAEAAAVPDLPMPTPEAIAAGVSAALAATEATAAAPAPVADESARPSPVASLPSGPSSA